MIWAREMCNYTNRLVRSNHFWLSLTTIWGVSTSTWKNMQKVCKTIKWLWRLKDQRLEILPRKMSWRASSKRAMRTWKRRLRDCSSNRAPNHRLGTVRASWLLPASINKSLIKWRSPITHPWNRSVLKVVQSYLTENSMGLKVLSSQNLLISSRSCRTTIPPL